MGTAGGTAPLDVGNGAAIVGEPDAQKRKWAAHFEAPLTGGRTTNVAPAGTKSRNKKGVPC
jgi:hypothetical protein